MAKIIKIIIGTQCAGDDGKQLELSCIAGEMKNGKSHFGNTSSLSVSYKFNHILTIQPINPTPNYLGTRIKTYLPTKLVCEYS